MDEKKLELPDLLRSCFINWINTLEIALKSKSEKNHPFKENKGLKHLREKFII